MNAIPLNQNMKQALFSREKQNQNNQHQENEYNVIQTNEPDIEIHLVVNQHTDGTNEFLEHLLHVGILKKRLNQIGRRHDKKPGHKPVVKANEH